MTILNKYIIKQHSLLLLITLGIGLGIFVIIDLIERADIFLSTEDGASFIIPYYLAKLPGIISQILPAVFLLSSVILLCLMISAREFVALQAGGISKSLLAKLLMLCGIFWAIVQFVCSQFLASPGDEIAGKIWSQDVRQRQVVEKKIEKVWFIKDDYLIQLDELFESGKGSGFLAYQIENEQEILNIISAKSYQVQDEIWTLKDVTLTKPSSFEKIEMPEAQINLEQSINYFFVNEDKDPQLLDFMLLGEAIDRLKESGSNVEFLQTIWFGKISYALSIVIFAFVAVAIISYKENVYLAVILAVVVAFLTYVLNMMGESLGKEGAIPPIFGAFGTQIFVFILAFSRIQYVNLKS